MGDLYHQRKSKARIDLHKQALARFQLSLRNLLLNGMGYCMTHNTSYTHLFRNFTPSSSFTLNPFFIYISSGASIPNKRNPSFNIRVVDFTRARRPGSCLSSLRIRTFPQYLLKACDKSIVYLAIIDGS